MWISDRISNSDVNITSDVIRIQSYIYEGLFNAETAEKRPEEQTEGGHHRRHSPDES